MAPAPYLFGVLLVLVEEQWCLGVPLEAYVALVPHTFNRW
jgi:hypothetical protein